MEITPDHDDIPPQQEWRLIQTGCAIKVLDPSERTFYESDFVTGWQKDHWSQIVARMNRAMVANSYTPPPTLFPSPWTYHELMEGCPTYVVDDAEGLPLFMCQEKTLVKRIIKAVNEASYCLQDQPPMTAQSEWEVAQHAFLQNGEKVGSVAWTGNPATMGHSFEVPRGKLQELLSELAASRGEVQRWRECGGQQQHTVICSADRRAPVGGPGCVCMTITRAEYADLKAKAKPLSNEHANLNEFQLQNLLAEIKEELRISRMREASFMHMAEGLEHENAEMREIIRRIERLPEDAPVDEKEMGMWTFSVIEGTLTGYLRHNSALVAELDHIVGKRICNALNFVRGVPDNVIDPGTKSIRPWFMTTCKKFRDYIEKIQTELDQAKEELKNCRLQS